MQLFVFFSIAASVGNSRSEQSLLIRCLGCLNAFFVVVKSINLNEYKPTSFLLIRRLGCLKAFCFRFVFKSVNLNAYKPRLCSFS